MSHHVFIHSFIYLLVSPPQMVVATGGRSAKSTGGGHSCPGSLEPTPQIPMLLRVPYMDYRDGCVGSWGPGIGYFAAHKGAEHTHTLGPHGWERWSEWSEPLVTVNRGEAQAELAR